MINLQENGNDFSDLGVGKCMGNALFNLMNSNNKSGTDLVCILYIIYMLYIINIAYILNIYN